MLLPRSRYLAKHAFSALNEAFQQAQERFIARGAPAEQLTPSLVAFQNLGFSLSEVQEVFHVRKSSILLGGPKNDVQKLSAFLKSSYGFDEAKIRAVVRKNPKILALANEEIQGRVQGLQKELELSQEEAVRLLHQYPLVFENPAKDIAELGGLFQNYLKFNHKQLGRVLVNSPYLFSIDRQKMHFNLRQLYNLGFQMRQLQKICLFTTEFLQTKPSVLKTLLLIYTRLLGSIDASPALVTEHPKLLLLEPRLMVATKINILKAEGLDHTQIGQILSVQPSLFYRSNESLRMKIKFFSKQFSSKLVDHPAFPKIIDFEFQPIFHPRLTCLQAPNDLLRLLSMPEAEYKQLFPAYNSPQGPFSPEYDLFLKFFHEEPQDYAIYR